MNKITATIEFNFKGEYITASTELNLDELLQQHRTLPPLHQLLATINNIDSYSYEYEVLLSEEIQFSHAQGPVADFLTNNQFDQIGFEHYWHEQALLQKLAPIIKQQLDIDDINQHPKLKSVIISAYKIGLDSE